MWIVIVGSSSSERLTDVGTNEVVSTVDLEIFVVKNIFVVCANHENKKHEIYFTTDNHYSLNNFGRTISQHS